MLIEPDWKSAGGQHMWDSHQITPAEANQAVNDADAVWFDPDPKSKSGLSGRVIGWSHTAEAVLTVILVHTEDGEGWYGGNAWPSNAADRRHYNTE